MPPSVVIPSLRGGPQLVALVGQLSSGAEVLVADNGLQASVRSAAETAGATMVAMGGNAGFARAVNMAAARASGDALVVINDDITPQPGFLDALVAPLASGAQVCAGVLLQERAPSTIETAGVVIDAALVGYEHLHGEPVAVLDGDPADPLGPCGGAAAYDLEAFRAAGGFDAGLFAYWEDVDLAVRMRALGARCALAPAARALHARSATLGDARRRQPREGPARSREPRPHRAQVRPAGRARSRHRAGSVDRAGRAAPVGRSAARPRARVPPLRRAASAT